MTSGDATLHHPQTLNSLFSGGAALYNRWLTRSPGNGPSEKEGVRGPCRGDLAARPGSGLGRFCRVPQAPPQFCGSHCLQGSTGMCPSAGCPGGRENSPSWASRSPAPSLTTSQPRAGQNLPSARQNASISGSVAQSSLDPGPCQTSWDPLLQSQSLIY